MGGGAVAVYAGSPKIISKRVKEVPVEDAEFPIGSRLSTFLAHTRGSPIPRLLLPAVGRSEAVSAVLLLLSERFRASVRPSF
jgi:hypothetical protein